jgi:hypothetical protein
VLGDDPVRSRDDDDPKADDKPSVGASSGEAA